jgi:carboxypeptidase C (cathepsin A)
MKTRQNANPRQGSWMRKVAGAVYLIGLLALPLNTAALAQTATPPAATNAPATPPAATNAPAIRLLPADATTHHTPTMPGASLNYTATAGTLPLVNARAEVRANLFYVAYRIEGQSDARPITFVFNGGPGAASAYLHIAALGPRVLALSAAGIPPLEGRELTDNIDTWLDFTDLVFVDPVATGYSRSTAGTPEANREFFGVDKDADALTDFVRLYLTRAGREFSAIFLAGESYGGFRSVLIAERLLREGFAVRGIVLISPALEFSLLRSNPHSVLPLALVLPSLAATHAELGGDQRFAARTEVEQFARTQYLLHLTAGSKANAEIDRALTRYTGLGLEVIERLNHRVSAADFSREYRHQADRMLSFYDATVSVAVPRGGGVHFDPILDAATQVLGPAFAHYAHDELGYRTDMPYWLLNREVSGQWDFGTSPTHQGFAGSLDNLQEARTMNPGLGVLIANGLTDLVTPYATSRYVVDQLAPLAGARPIELAVFAGGHMMYLRAGSRRELKSSARALYRGVLRPS